MPKTTARCKHCGTTDYVDQMYKVNSFSKNYFFICYDCTDREYSYSHENAQTAHKQAKHGFTVSIEFETSSRKQQDNLLYEYGFIPSSDSSIYGTEWKSPIYRNLSGIKQMLRSIEKVVDPLTNKEGTHFNVGHVEHINGNSIEWLGRYYHSLFVPLSDYLVNNPEKCERVFGRQLGGYCGAIDFSSSPYRHENYINLEHSTHIEFRAMKFINAEQYFHAMKMCIEMVKCIITNFLAYTDEDQPIRLKQARKTGQKLIRIFEKYYDSAPI